MGDVLSAESSQTSAVAGVEELRGELGRLLEEVNSQLTRLEISQGLKPLPGEAATASDSLQLRTQLESLRERQARLQSTARKRESRPERTLRQKALLAVGRLSVGRVPESTDAFGFDRGFASDVEPLLDFLYETYWRVEASGFEKIPRTGPAILVANHAGLLPFDALMLQVALRRNHPSRDDLRVLIEDWFYRRPGLSVLMSRLGCVPARQINARKLLADGALVGAFPEGAHGVLKPFKQRYRVQRFGRGGVIELAAATKAPMFPVAIVGSEEIYPLLFRTERLARMLGLNVLPITPQFPLLGPLGLVPLPSAWRIHVGDAMPVALPAANNEEYDIALHAANEELRKKVQDELETLFVHRRSSFLSR